MADDVGAGDVDDVRVELGEVAADAAAAGRSGNAIFRARRESGTTGR